MTLAEAETRFTPRAPEPPAPATAPARTCEACGAGLAAGQEWCLECGTAAPAAAAAPPGRRAFATVSSLTVLLLAGAAVASYAAVSGDAGRQAAAPPPPPANAIAQAPPAVTPPPAATTPAAPPPAATTPTKALPKVAPPATPQPAPTVTAKPVTPVKPVTRAPSKPTTHHHAAPRTGATTGQQVTLDPSNGTLYDPYGRASAQGDPTRALDGNPSTSWFVTVATPDEMGVGYVVDITNPVNVRSLMLWTHTEGFEVEVYGTGSTVLPPDVVDSRWIHLATRTNVDASQPGVAAPDGNVAGDGKERIVLNSGTKRFRHLLLWFTQPPETGQTVRLGELQLFT
ncbi:MAG TPA: hypothetical protein VFT42_02710 [Solirubrobacteraceae bacterium]|nr:hypothetical protein [Solirubrobacteraceae bacterium]